MNFRATARPLAFSRAPGSRQSGGGLFLASINNLAGKEIFELVRSDLQKVEEEFCLQSVTSVEPISEIAQYLQGSGGKRLRPALVLLSSKMCGYQEYPAIRLGAVVELIHTATLVHDDIIDGADTRRGRPSANYRWGNHMSVLAGDWLYMQAFQLALRVRSFPILDLLITLTQMMVEGELLQLERIGRIGVTEAGYMELIDRKTARLFSACARPGAPSRGGSETAGPGWGSRPGSGRSRTGARSPAPLAASSSGRPTCRTGAASRP